jgi:hypothetical protein
VVHDAPGARKPSPSLPVTEKCPAPGKWGLSLKKTAKIWRKMWNNNEYYRYNDNIW